MLFFFFDMARETTKRRGETFFFLKQQIESTIAMLMMPTYNKRVAHFKLSFESMQRTWIEQIELTLNCLFMSTRYRFGYIVRQCFEFDRRWTTFLRSQHEHLIRMNFNASEEDRIVENTLNNWFWMEFAIAWLCWPSDY